MVSKPEILEALQFSFIYSKDPINTTGSPRETLTWQYAGTSEPADLPSSSTFTGWTDFTDPEKTAFEAVLAQIETFLNVDFVQVTGSDDPDLNVGNVTLEGPTAGYGGSSIRSFGTQITQWDGFVVFDNTLDMSLQSRTNLLLHEMGHALGMKHPFSGSPNLPADMDNNKYSVMAYAENPDNGKDSDAMMLYDVYALQDIWGGAEYQTGDSIYTGPRNGSLDAVWDTGGTDVFDAGARAGAVRIDLREGKFSTFGTYEDVVITYGTRIENAIGGSGGDTITGNGMANLLLGNGGDDSISAGGGRDEIKGGGGKDVLKGGRGKDQLWGDDGGDILSGQNQNDTLKGGNGRDILKGGNGNDTLKGGNGNDTLKGGNGNDTLYGQNGNDRLTGNQGSDRFVFARNGDKDTIRDFQDDVDVIRIKGLGDTAQVLDKASFIDGDVVFDFGNGDMLIVRNTTMAEISDDILT